MHPMLTLPAAVVLMLAQPATAADPAPTAEPWWHDAVFYEVFVRSFADSAEGPLAGDGIGDFPGLTARLNYLNDGDPATDTDLGVTAVWLMPIKESPSYHGYDVTDYHAVEGDYGTAADFKAFTQAAHERGVRVVIDLVLNHCSSRHPWFVEAAASPDSPKRDWFIWSDTDPAYRGPWGQQVWHSVSRGGSGPFYYGCFTRGMPDLNLNNPEVTAELKSIARFWIEDMGVDGFRLDAIKHFIEDGPVQENTQASIDWLEDFNAYCKSLNPDFFTVGEVWSSTDQVARYIPGAVDTAFEFDLGDAIIRALNTGDATALRARIRQVLDAYDTPVATFLTNHDQARLMTQLGNDPGKARAAAALLLTLPGVPFIYYGEEIGHTGAKPDPNIRTPMQWTPEPSGFTTGTPWQAPQPDAGRVHVAAQTDDPGSLLAHYRDLIALRHGDGALHAGRTLVLEPAEPGLVAFVREQDDRRVLVVVNMSDESIGWYAVPLDRPAAAGRVREISGNRRPFGSLSDDRATFRGGGIRPYELFVLELPSE
jgi:alpha-amylase